MINCFMLRFAMALVICASMAAFAPAASAADTETTPAANAQQADYAAGRKWVEAKDWKRAVAAFERAAAAEPKSADAWNMLGYTRRWAGDTQGAFVAYDRALALDPKHRGAHSYLGIAHVRNNDVANAKAQLTKVEGLCGKSCEEYKELADAIAKHQPK
jgi:cytochrome c-type biogenesis protein CcmH/NrfG